MPFPTTLTTARLRAAVVRFQPHRLVKILGVAARSVASHSGVGAPTSSTLCRASKKELRLHGTTRAASTSQNFEGQLAALPDATRIYPGHDYLVNNLRFTLDREPGNDDARALLDSCQDQDPSQARITTLGEEKRINTFFRLHNPEIIERLHDTFPRLAAAPSPREVFLALRELRNHW